MPKLPSHALTTSSWQGTPQVGHPLPFCRFEPCFIYIVILLYMYSAHSLNCCFSCKGSCHASPSMYTCTLRVLYIVAESLYPLYTSFQLHRMVSPPPQPLPPDYTLCQCFVLCLAMGRGIGADVYLNCYQRYSPQKENAKRRNRTEREAVQGSGGRKRCQLLRHGCNCIQ